MNRRRFLLVSGATLLVPTLPGCDGKAPVDDSGGDTGTGPTSAPDRPAEPAPWAAPGTEDATAFAWSVQAGDATDTAVRLGFRTTEPQVDLVLMRGDDTGWTEVHRETLAVTGEATAWSPAAPLEPDTVYAFALYAADGSRRSAVGRFRTALAADGWRKLTLGATSCIGSADAPWPVLTHAAGARVDAFLLLGDTVYADPAATLEAYRAEWRAQLSTRGLYDLTASTSVVATWDDHEVANNWWESGVSEDQYLAALTAFRESLPQGQGPTGSIWRSIRWGRVAELVVLDCRSERGEGRYISVDQMEWLKRTLEQSPCRFKLILNSVPINDYTDLFGDVEAEDRWQGYPEQREEILQFIVDAGIGGVLWVTGDVHHAMLCHPDPPGGGPGEAQWEVAVGPAGSTPNVLVEAFTDTTGQYPILFADWNWAQLDLDPGLGTIGITFWNRDGAVIASQTITV